MGEQGRGVRTIIEMVAMTRLDCVIGSASGMHAAVRQAVHHCTHRSAFGRRLVRATLRGMPVSVRDPGSADLLAALGLPRPVVAADLALALPDAGARHPPQGGSPDRKSVV